MIFSETNADLLLEKLDPATDCTRRGKRSIVLDLKIKLEAVFKSRSRQEWCELMEGTDVCFAPVLDINEAPLHPHNIERGTYIEVGGMTQPAPAPRFSRTITEVVSAPHEPGSDLETVLNDWNISRKTGESHDDF